MAFGSQTLPQRPRNDLNGNKDEVEDSLVIGIDFGTTYSGVAWATKVDYENNDINYIASWPGNGLGVGKAPTELWYDEDDEPYWGYEVPADGDPNRWFKILLLRDEDLDIQLKETELFARIRATMAESGKTALDLVTEYLRLLWGHTISTIERARGESEVEALAIHVVLTVPAIWKGYARQLMEVAARDAGILDSRAAGKTELTLAPEPEAAALSTLLEQGSGVRPSHTYVICDAGGGTVDLITYQVQSINPMVLQEAVEGTGGLCGGIFIDQAFKSLCRGRLEEKAWNQLTPTGIGEIMKTTWEYGIKPQFKPTKTGKRYIVPLPAEAFRNKLISSLDDTSREPHIKNGRIYFRGTDIERAFTDVFAAIDDLVAGQIQKATQKGLNVTGIILVGGLGASPYLYQYLRDKHSQAGISVLQSGGTKPVTAICRGAVIRGFLEQQRRQLVGNCLSAPIMVVSTISRLSYGVRFHSTYDPIKHLAEDKYWDEDEGEMRASNQMEWYLKRGDKVSNLKPIRHYFYQLLHSPSFFGTLKIELYQCEDEVPPSRLNSRVKTVSTISCSLSVEYRDLPDFTCHSGKVIKKLNYGLELIPSGASAEFVVYIHGKKQSGNDTKISFA